MLFILEILSLVKDIELKYLCKLWSAMYLFTCGDMYNISASIVC